MAPILVTAQSRSGKTIATIEIDSEETVAELKKKFFRIKKRLYPSRQRFSLPPEAGQVRGQALDDEKKLSDYKITGNVALIFKDLGPQIGYATVFFWEYFGPLVIYPLFFFCPKLFYPWYSGPDTRYLVQQLAVAYWCFHYSKRIYETFFVHRFGHDTMPLTNLFKNCAYYWSFAAWVAYFVNHPLYTPPPEMQSIVCLGLALLCQASNYTCHVMLSNLRKPGEKAYKIPRGFLFNFITCPNYTAEIWGWILFTAATQTVTAGIFTLVGALQMIDWAKAKHARLRKLFDGKDGREKYPRRWIIFPPVI